MTQAVTTGPGHAIFTDAEYPVFTDPDGTTISETSGGTNITNITDTLGTTAFSNIPLNRTAGDSAIPAVILASSATTYTDTNGNTQTYSINTTPLNIATNFGCLNQDGYPEPTDFSTTSAVPMLTSIVLPTEGQYTISYEPTPGKSGYYTGRIAQVTLPSGGSISYAYSGGNNGLNCYYATVPTLTVTLTDNNGHTSQYTYTSSLSLTTPADYAPPGANVNYTVTKTDPVGNQTVYEFAGEYQTQVKYYQGSASGTPLKTVSTCYNGNTSNCATFVNTSANMLPITQTNVYTSYGTLSSDLVQKTYDKYNNVTSEIDMDYGNVGSSGQCTSATAGVCKLTTTTYGTWSGSSCTAMPYAPSLPCDVKVTNNNTGTVLAETRYTYSATYHPTAISQWVSGTTWLTTNNMYNSNGTLEQTEDPNSNITKYAYAATGSGGCNGVLLTSTTYPVTAVGSSSQTWNCNGGVVATSTNVNSKTTTYSYNDPLWRLTDTVYPDTGSTSMSYSTGTSLPWSVTTTTAINASTNLVSLTQYDGLGRVTENEVTSDLDASNGIDYVDTTYDLLGNVHTKSNPHRTSSSPTDGIGTYYYDALGRPVEDIEQDGTSKLWWCYNDTQVTPAAPNCSSQLGTTNSGTWVDVSDEVGNHWQQISDSLGRLTKVLEPNGTTQVPSMETDYTYDLLSNLLTVTQCGGACPSSSAVDRTFTYDGLSRLLEALNPEVNTSTYTTYTYDGDNNVVTKVSPAVNVASGTQTITYCYDGMNRLTYKFYPGSTGNCTTPTAPSATYSYDTSSVTGALNDIGNLTDEKAYIGTTLVSERKPYLFDTMSRLQAEQQCPFSSSCTTPYVFNYTYDLAGDVTSSNNGLSTTGYPAYALAFGLSYDSVDRLQSVNVTTQPSGWSGNASYPTALLNANSTSPVAYDPMAHLVSGQLGVPSGNGTPAIQMTRAYDSHGRITSEADDYGSTPLYSYSVPTSGGYLANSDLASSTDGVMGGWTFGYDYLNRLTSAVSPASGSWPIVDKAGCWKYDAFGNRTEEAFSTGSTPPSPCANGTAQNTPVTYSTSNNNHVASFTYDAAGNVTVDSQNAYYYDAEGRLCGVAVNLGGLSYYQYLYDAEGRRVGKGSTTSLNCNAPTSGSGFALTNQYLLGLNGEQVTELASTGAAVPQHSNFVVGGNVMTTYDFAHGGLHFMLTDPLGTKRVQVSGTGVAELDCISLPFGNNIGNTRVTDCQNVGGNTAPDATEHHLTGKERDDESGNDYFGARYYSSAMGRFSSPDPSGLEYANPENPQSLNLYSYVLNNPLHYVDPTGMYCDYSDHNDPSSGFDQSQFDYNSNSGECGQNGGQWVDDAYTHNGADDANRPQYAVSSNTDSGNNPWTLTDFQAMYQAWNTGVLPQQLNYGPWSWESIDMSHNWAVNQARQAYIKAGCPGSGTAANSFYAGHVAAAVDSWGNVVLGQPDYLELQVGGFSGTITGGSDTATFTVTNPMSNSSFIGQSYMTGGHSTDNPNGPNGPKHTVIQTFKWTEENLCHQ